MTSVAFFTVTHSQDYDFLLGSIEHHAEMGMHLVLDTSPSSKAEQFKRLPSTVRWVHEPHYGSGWKNFRLRASVERAMHLAREFGADVLAYVDSDEFLSKESVTGLFPHAEHAVIQVHTTHWKEDGPYMFGESEWHTRLWPNLCDMQILKNVDWTKHPAYNGNPEHHPVPMAPPGLPMLRVPGSFHHHLHYVIGEKSADTDTGDQTIDGWPDKGVRVPPVAWPVKLRQWKEQGICPSMFYR